MAFGHGRGTTAEAEAGYAGWAAWDAAARWAQTAHATIGRSLRGELDAGRAFLFLPVVMAAGILLYFAADREPWLAAGPLALAVFSSAAILLRRRAGAPFAVALGLAFLAAGFSAASLRTASVAAPVLDRVRIAQVSGYVESVEVQAASVRLLLHVSQIEGMAPGALPGKVRLVAQGRPEVKAGAFVAVRARLMPPPEPSRPGGYDFAREAFFSGIGAVGSVLGPVAVAQAPAAAGWGLSLRALVDRARNDLTARIVGAVEGPSGAVGAALVTGKRGLIPEETNDALRGAGIYHVVSISGLHMVLAAGMVFWLVRATLALSAELALRWPLRKIAALAGMGAALVYNTFAGAEIATQRSLVMSLVLMGAILVDRPALSMRNLAFAAMVVLALEPESLLGPSFQMSFAAVAALIALFERAAPGSDPEAGAFTPLRQQQPSPRDAPPPGPVARLLGSARRHVVLAVLSTLVAEAATAPFALYHFQRGTLLGIVGNILTLPLVSIVVMPMAMLGMVAMPFGLDTPVWRVMGLGVQGMLSLSAWVAGLPGAVRHSPAFGHGALLGLSAAVVLATLWRGWLRLSAVPAAVAGVALAASAPRMDLVVPQDARALAFRTEDGRLAILGRGAGDFAVTQWLAADADGRSPDDPSLVKGTSCDPIGCVGRLLGGGAIVLATAPAAFEEDCRRATILVTPLRAPPWCTPALLIDRASLARTGAVSMALGSEGIAGVKLSTGPPMSLPGQGFAEAAGTTVSVIAETQARPPGVERPWLRAPPPGAVPQARPPPRMPRTTSPDGEEEAQ
jgi:competence protein ComEC